MSYLEFRTAMLPFKIFGVNDVRKVFPSFDSKRLNEWQHRGYIQKIINKWYRFNEIADNEMLQMRISNSLMRPSYVSLESALSYYQFIPEGVYSTMAVTTVKTITYNTPAGNFSYRSIKPAYFFGYTVLQLDQIPVLIAEPEKAIIDFLYLHSRLNSIEDFLALRLDTAAIAVKINWERLERYAGLYESATVMKRIRLFKKNILHVTTQ